MTAPGDTFSTLLREVWTPELYTTYFTNNFLTNGSLFEKVTPPGGDSIDTGYIYTTTTNAEAFNYDDPMPEADNTSQVRAYHTKTWYHGSCQTYGQYADMQANGGTYVPVAQDRLAADKMVKNLMDVVNVALIGELETDPSASGTYGDGALTRSTYDMTSYGETTSTALTLAHLEDSVEALENVTYGPVRREDLVILMPRNQITNYSRLLGGVAYNTTNSFTTVDLAVTSGADPGMVQRASQFESIPIVAVPDMTNTTILILHKPDVKIYETKSLELMPKNYDGYGTKIYGVCAYNAVVSNPKNHAILTNKTA